MKEVVGFPMYTLSEDGKVYSKYIKGGCGRVQDEKRELAPVLDSNGYYIFSLIDEFGKKKKLSLHRLLAITFIPNPENKSQVNHIDGDKRNNDLSNLEWTTPKENTNHAIRAGLSVPGNTSKVRLAQYVLESKELIRIFDSFKDAQRETGIQYTNISKVCRGLRGSAGGFFWSYL